ncbi:MAG: hypothetical protein WA395_08380 [Nitrososphaeraceae archaeon]
MVIAAVASVEIIRSSELLLELAHTMQNARYREYGLPLPAHPFDTLQGQKARAKLFGISHCF